MVYSRQGYALSHTVQCAHSVLPSAAMALIGNRSLRERLYAATYLFLCRAAATLLGRWAMYLVHG